jgi:hypothetical protein
MLPRRLLPLILALTALVVEEQGGGDRQAVQDAGRLVR